MQKLLTLSSLKDFPSKTYYTSEYVYLIWFDIIFSFVSWYNT